MPILYDIQAEIIDLSNDAPKSDDVFLVDSNVWYWFTYTRASLSSSPPRQYQVQNYPDYTKAVLNAGGQILYSGLSLAELMHRIEKTELEIYESINGQIKPKEFRHNLHVEHGNVIAEVETAWMQVENLANLIPVTICKQSTQAVLNRFQTEKVDGYDLFILETMKENGIVKIITDDGDFSTVPGIQVFTANRTVLSKARDVGKLVVR